MSPDGKHLLTVADGRGYVQLWSTVRRERLKTFLAPGRQDRELTAAFTPDSRRLLINFAGDRENFTGYDTNNGFYTPWPESSLWKIDGLKRIAVVVDRKRESFFSKNVQFSADGRRMIFTDGSRPASVFDAFTGRHLQTFMRDDGRGAVEGRLSADGSRATVAYQNGSVIEYDVKRGLVLTVLKPASVP